MCPPYHNHQSFFVFAYFLILGLSPEHFLMMSLIMKVINSEILFSEAA